MKAAITFAAAAAIAAAAATPAAAQDSTFTLRNDSSHVLLCGVAPMGRSTWERFTLRRGDSRSWTATRTHRLICETPVRPGRYRLEPGGSYRLVDRDHGRAVAVLAR